MDRIIAVDLNTGGNKLVWALPATGLVALSMSPDGRTIAIARRDPGADRTHFARLAVDGSGYRELHAISGNSNIAWTHDGRGILFDQEPAHDGKRQLMRLPADREVG